MSALTTRMRAHLNQATPLNPLTVLGWSAAFWADDPAWSNPGNGVAVSTWRDGGTLGTATATQGTAANRPIYRTGVANLNNRSAVQFDGSNDYLQNTTLPVIAAQPYTIVAVLDVISTGASTPIVSDQGPGATTADLFWTAGAKWATYTGGGATFQSTVTATTGAHALRLLANNASSTWVVDGTTNTGTTTNALGFTGVTLGALRTGSNASSIKLAFWGIYSGDLSAHNQWPALKVIINTLYGVTLA